MDLKFLNRLALVRLGGLNGMSVGGGQSRYSYSIKVGRVANKIGGVRTGVGRENPRGVLVALLERLEKAREEDGVAAAAALKLLRG